MIGIVLWSDFEDRKAVFWCEDHGDLAYYDALQDQGSKCGLLNAGDMVEFDLSIDGQIRRANNAKVIRPKVCNGLQEHLRATAAKTDAASNTGSSGDVVAFPARVANSAPVSRARNG